MTERTEIVKTLTDTKIRKIETDPAKPNYFRFIGKYGTVLFTVEKTFIFDRDGNYFEDDTE